jgi:hypothetical protein
LFGKLGKNIVAQTVVDEKNQNIISHKETKIGSKPILAEEIENPYKQKYNDIKERFEQL